jgi:hypothetical protein
MPAKKAKAKKAQAKAKAAKKPAKKAVKKPAAPKPEAAPEAKAFRRGSFCLKPEPSSNNPLFYWSPPAIWQEGSGAIV